MLITVSGIDCAGKTTQIEHLCTALARRGQRPFMFWFRPGYSRELNFLKSMARKLMPSALPTANQTEKRQEVFSAPGVRSTWLAMAVVDMLFQYGLKLRMLQRMGRTIICDRYLHDSMLDLSFRFPDLDTTSSAWARAVKHVIPNPDASFLLTLPHQEMLRRMEFKDEPFPDPPRIRDRRFAAYQQMAESGEFRVVDASASIDEVHRSIMARLAL